MLTRDGHARERAAKGQALLSRAAYGAVFAIVTPAALAAWARGSRSAVHLPVVHLPAFGVALFAGGAAIMLIAMSALWRRGGGLPMNAFPPPRFVATGIYALVPHPIYAGFVVACAGAAIYAGSASGLWLVAPSAAMACAALVLGYELPDLRSRFGAGRTSVWLAEARAAEPAFIERVRVYLVVILPWLAGFELIGLLGRAPDAYSTYFAFERRIPIVPWTEAIYASVYLAVLAAPLLAGSGVVLRRFALRGLTAMALIFPLYLLLPIYVPPRPFVAASPLGTMLGWERTPASGVCALPSFHVVWACVVASVLGAGGRGRRIAWWVWALLVALSCVTTGMHSIADVLAGFAAYALVVALPALWRAALAVAERIANSWREWRLGPVRVINHGGYAGAGALSGMLIIASLVGRRGEILALSICLCSLAGAVLWAQVVEGSPALLRPMGFYGGMLGSMAGGLPALWLHQSVWVAFAAICVAAPWIQALGRLRCLVQGCCHGRPCHAVPGIRYTHPRSRVCRLTMFGAVEIHATPLYSISWNVVTGAALLRLVQVHGSASVMCGIYLLLSGCGRFVEEAYRGEPQTRTCWGLRFYQWIAVAVAVAGAAITCVQGSPSLVWTRLNGSAWLLAFACGALTWFVSGVDFPESSRRFARLT